MTQGSCSTLICLGFSWPRVRSYDAEIPTWVCHSGFHFSRSTARSISKM